MSETTFDIENSQKATYRVKRAITVLNENGASWGGFVENYDKLDLISDIRITFYDGDGRVIKKVKSKEILDIAYTSPGSLYDDNRQKIYTPVDIDYPYTIETEVTKIKTSSLYYPEWNVRNGDKLAVENASLRVTVPPKFELRFKPLNFDQKPTITSSKKGRLIYSWRLENMPAIQRELRGPEVYQVSPRVLLAPSDFSMEGINGSMRTWSEFGQWINKLNENRDTLPDELKTEINDLTADLGSTEEKIKAVYEYLQGHTRYVSIQLGIGGFQPFSALDVSKNGYGDCKALTNFTYSLLKSIGIKSNYTLIKAGKSEDDILVDFPSQQFNHVILSVPLETDTLWLECTSQEAPFNFLGGFTGDRHALMISETGGALVKTPKFEKEESSQVRTGTVTFDDEGNGIGTINTEYRGRQYDDHYFIAQESKKEQENFILNTIGIPVFDLKSFNYEDTRSRDPVLTQTLSLELKKFGSVSGKRIFFTPNLMNRGSMIENTSIEDRKMPIVSRYAYTDVDSITFKLPLGYQPEYIPEYINEVSDFGVYALKYSYDADKREILMVRRIIINKGVYEPSSANEYFEFVRMIVAGDKMKIVLLKSEN